MGANLFHDLRVVAGQMAYPVLRVVDGGGEPAAATASIILASVFCSSVKSWFGIIRPSFPCSSGFRYV